MSLSWGGTDKIYVDSEAIVCPECKGHRYIGHKLCLECYGVGRIVFAQERKPGMFLTWRPALKFFGKVLLAAAVIWLLIVGALAL